jgi:hypothetical protein
MRTFVQKQNSTQKSKTAGSARPSRTLSGQSREVSSILHLQRTIGNQAVQRLLQVNHERRDDSPVTSASPHFEHDFSRIPLHAKAQAEIQPKLTISTPGDASEQEADRVAGQVLRQKIPEGEENQRIRDSGKTVAASGKGELDVNEGLEDRLNRSKHGGSSIPQELQAFFEPRMQFDFGKVRIHTDSEAAQINQELGARAFTHGSDIYFGAGQYNPRSNEGKGLLAHELTHVMQQMGCNLRINRNNQPAPASGFSVVRATYERLVCRAVQNLLGRLLRSTTFAPVVQPILQSMLAQVVWRDSAGTEHGGAAVTYTVPGTRGTTLNLTMILDDMINPPEAGQFQHSNTSGRLSVRVRSSATVEALTEVLYHESMHMMSWIIGRYGVAAAPGVEMRAVRGLELGRFSTQISGIRRELDDLARTVNARRRASSRDQITANQLDQAARWLMEEVQVRAETEVFQLALQVEQQRGARARVYIPTLQYGSINLDTVNRYVFEFSHTFTPDDRRGMTEDERRTLRRLTEILEGFFQLHVRRRFSLTAHTSTIPPTRPEFSPRPLEPPSFIERIGEATHREPF